MIIKCHDCGFSEKVSLDFLAKLIGAVLVFVGFWAWVAYIFAGTGFAMLICIAIMTGGVAMLWCKDKIINFIKNRGYKCPQCGATKWEA